jgi:hypothetical protein
METIDNVLKYIQIYTECDDFTLKRIRVLLDKLPKEIVVEKVVQETKIMYIQKKTYKEYKEIGIWAEKYFNANGVTYEEVAASNREHKTLRVRNKFCIEAYKNGYAYKTIGKYLGMSHSTIMHCVNQIKTK